MLAAFKCYWLAEETDMHWRTEQLACALLLCCTDMCACFFLNDLAACIDPPPPPSHTHRQMWLVEVHITICMGSTQLWDFVSFGSTFCCDCMLSLSKLCFYLPSKLSPFLLLLQAMNRSLANVILGGYSITAKEVAEKGEAQSHQETDISGAVDAITNARSVIIVPGYGLAVASAQYAIADLVKTLTSKDIKVR